jgi:hypothetical protein
VALEEVALEPPVLADAIDGAHDGASLARKRARTKLLEPRALGAHGMAELGE